uniref:Uncharacterized protein n=1 Tax=Micrurus surinamensis TaxID=129470 RepID=A0A2D4NTJ8_MICSU
MLRSLSVKEFQLARSRKNAFSAVAHCPSPPPSLEARQAPTLLVFQKYKDLALPSHRGGTGMVFLTPTLIYFLMLNFALLASIFNFFIQLCFHILFTYHPEF